LFIRRFYRRTLPAIHDLSNKTLWAFINFNNDYLSPNEVKHAVLDGFIESLCEQNSLSFQTHEELERLFRAEMTQWDKGPVRLFKETNVDRYHQERYLHLTSLAEDKAKVTSAISRMYTGERRIGLVVVFDNVDKRSRDTQLAIFEAAQWFKELTRAFVIVNMRDTTYLAHRDEKPLDAFKDAVNFYVRAPRFSLMIKKRLEIVLEHVQSDSELGLTQRFHLEAGARLTYASNRLGHFLLGIYLALFDRRTAHIGAAIESLVAKDARNALTMFTDIIASPHIPTSAMSSTAIAGPV